MSKKKVTIENPAMAKMNRFLNENYYGTSTLKSAESLALDHFEDMMNNLGPEMLDLLDPEGAMNDMAGDGFDYAQSFMYELHVGFQKGIAKGIKDLKKVK